MNFWLKIGKPEFIFSTSVVGLDLTLNKTFYFCIFFFFSVADGRKYFFLSMSIFQRMKCSWYFKMHVDVIEASISAVTLTATVLLFLKNGIYPLTGPCLHKL